MIEISPIRLKKEMQWIDVADSFISADDKNIVEYESVRERVCVTDRDEHHAYKQGARRGFILIEQVHPLVPLERAWDPWNSE